MIARISLLLWIAAWMVFALLRAPLVPVLEETTRVLYFHIPAAWISVLALCWSMGHSIAYLRTRRIEHDDHASAAAELGLIFCVAATITGSLWAKAQWGSYWNWDPRETSIFFLLLIYGAYLALRGSIDQEARRARLSAVYSVVAFVSVPFLMFIVPRMMFSLHPDPIISTTGKMHMDPLIRIGFYAMLLGFTGLFAWMLNLKIRVLRLARRVQTLMAPVGSAA